MSTSTFIEQLAAGHAADAKETLSNLLSARAFEALDTRKQELASTLFGGQVEEVELEEMDYGNDEEKSPSKGHGYSGVKVKSGKETTVKPMSVKSATSSAFKQLNKGFYKNSENKTNSKQVEEEVEQVEEGTMTGITLGQKVKNKQGGYNQDVHHKGEKIGHIEAYKHRTGMRYGSHHDASGDGSAGNRSPEESIDDIRFSHAQHLKDTKVKK